jgi:hypothetical protein
MQKEIGRPPAEPSKYITIKTLEVILLQTENHRPYITVQNFPGLHADMTIEQVRKMANALLDAANECEEKSNKDSHFPPTKRSYSL